MCWRYVVGCLYHRGPQRIEMSNYYEGAKRC